MPSHPDTDPLWIANLEELKEMYRAIASEPLLAVDTESNSLYAYREQVCLVQISTPGADYLVDTLALKELSLLKPIFANPRQQKIFHAAEYDILCLKRDYNFTFVNIFDTMIAARILSEPQVGLGSLLFNRFGIEMDKKYQRADWGKRPLPAAMLDYARMDTHYLIGLKALLEDQLKLKGFWELALEDFALVCSVEPSSTETNGVTCWKARGGNRLTSRETAILHALCTYRDYQAEKLNIPHFKVISNQVLVELSRTAPHTLQELKNVPGMSDNLIRRHASGLLHAIAEGEQAKPPSREPRHRPEKAVLERQQALHEWRKKLAEELKIESDVVLPRIFIERIASQAPRDLTELEKIMADIPWRYRQYGKIILSVIQNHGEI